MGREKPARRTNGSSNRRRQPLVRHAAQTNGAAAPGGPSDRQSDRRRMLADLCKLLGAQAGKPADVPLSAPAATPPTAIDPNLPRRQRQTLEFLLQGDGEKQIAARLGLSQHTVHIYVKALHKRFSVSSRSELLARFIPARHAQTQT